MHSIFFIYSNGNKKPECLTTLIAIAYSKEVILFSGNFLPLL